MSVYYLSVKLIIRILDIGLEIEYTDYVCSSSFVMFDLNFRIKAISYFAQSWTTFSYRVHFCISPIHYNAIAKDVLLQMQLIFFNQYYWVMWLVKWKNCVTKKFWVLLKTLLRQFLKFLNHYSFGLGSDFSIANEGQKMSGKYQWLPLNSLMALSLIVWFAQYLTWAKKIELLEEAFLVPEILFKTSHACANILKSKFTWWR